MRQIINAVGAPKAVGPYSHAVKAGGFLYVSGQVPLDPKTGQIVEGDITAQTRRVLENLSAIIIEAGASLGDVVKCTCFLTSMDDFSQFNAEYAKYFGDILPSRECVEVSRLPKDARVEVSAICAVK